MNDKKVIQEIVKSTNQNEKTDKQACIKVKFKNYCHYSRKYMYLHMHK